MNGPLFAYLQTLVGLSLIAVGGANAVVPELHYATVQGHHDMSSATFAQLFAIAQAAPGPNVLLVAVLGWKIAGPFGGFASLVAMVGPSSLIAYGVSRIWTRFEHARWRIVLSAVLAPLAVGLITASGIVVATTIGPTWIGIALVAASTLVVWRTKISPIVVLLVGAAAGLSGML
jgi:chromate transporter